VGGVEGVFEVTEIDLANSLFVENTAGDEGGAIYAKAAEMVIHNILADGNSGVGAVAVKGANVELINTIIVDQNGPAVYAAEIEELPTSFTVSYSDLWDNESNAYGIADPVGSDGNISEDPDLSGDYHLDASSPCVDAGDPGIRDADRSRSDMGYFGGPDAP
jgi:predicted outer membrane repeat protein